MPDDSNTFHLSALARTRGQVSELQPYRQSAASGSAGSTGNTLNPLGVSSSRPKLPTKQEKVEKTAADFEALLLQQMFNAMWANVPSDGLVSGGKDELTYREMYNEALAKNIAEHQSIGVKAVVTKELNNRDKE